MSQNDQMATLRNGVPGAQEVSLTSEKKHKMPAQPPLDSSSTPDAWRTTVLCNTQELHTYATAGGVNSERLAQQLSVWHIAHAPELPRERMAGVCVCVCAVSGSGVKTQKCKKKLKRLWPQCK